jgi:sialate O-acetylesterase
MRDFCGTVLLEKKFFITEEQAVTPAEILMGAFTDADKIYINGICCGSSYDRYASRIYPVAPGILRAGENVVCIHLYVFRGRGGAMPGKQYGIRFKKGKERWLDLSGTWDAQIRKQMEYLPEKTFFNYMASAMFNGMISPVSPYKICAVIYYQGESDVGHPNRYALEFRALVNDWRKSWKEKQLPIIYVQLAGFSDGNIKKQGTQWAEFREVQRQAMEIENTAMIQAYDVGEYNDLHPMDKKTLGMRAALAVHKLVYGEKEECTGPQVRKIRLDRDKRVYAVFDQPLQTGSKKDGCELVSEVELRKANGDYKRAYVTVDGNEICAWLSDGEEPTGIRYAWIVL